MAWQDLVDRLVDTTFATFTTPAVYTAPDGAPLEISVDFNRRHIDVGVSESGEVVTSQQITAEIKLRELQAAGLTDVVQDATLLISGVTYRVAKVEGPDHDGCIVARLYRDDLGA